jgi:hypothetical protein
LNFWRLVLFCWAKDFILHGLFFISFLPMVTKPFMVTALPKILFCPLSFYSHGKGSSAVSEKKLFLKLAAFLSGASLLATESLSFKFVDFTVGSFSFNYQTVVISFILGASVGGVLGNYFKKFFVVEWLLSLVNFLFAFYLVDILSLSAQVFESLTPYVNPQVLSSIIGASYVFPVALGLGVIFPFVSERLEKCKALLQFV